jgi:alpha-1,2-mannosyltransferase
MYPVYPLLALNAAISMHIILNYFGSTNRKGLVRMIPLRIRFAAIVFTAVVAIDVGLLRTIGMLTAYSAPLKVYEPLQQPGFTRTGDTLCLGKEWYRFPSSFFLPDGVKAKFIRSDFKGLLPGEFSEAKTGFGFFPGAWLEPPGMNDENKDDPSKYVRRLNAIENLFGANDIVRRTLNIAHFSWIRIFQTPLNLPSSQSTSSIPKVGKRSNACRISTPQEQA